MRWTSLVGVAVISALLIALHSVGPRTLTVDILDIGQGDATLIHHGRTQILIDGGPDRVVLSRIGERMPITDRRIDTVIVSHAHTDHYVGLQAIFERYEVDTFVLAAAEKSRAMDALIASAESRGARILRVVPGDRISAPDGTELVVLWPPPVGMARSENDRSLVLDLRDSATGRSLALFTGDIEAAAEAELVAADVIPDTDLLKIAHHGSKTSSASSMLEAASPEYAAVSVGYNRFGHPSGTVLHRLAAAGIRIFRTDEDGTIRFVREGDSLRLATP